MLIVAAASVDDARWEGAYKKETGGILIFQSAPDEPIHEVTTRGVKLRQELDDTLFQMPKKLRHLKLNKDFSKP